MSRTFRNVYVVDHPLVQHNLNMMRAKDCPHFQFRQCLTQIAVLMAYEALQVCRTPMQRARIETENGGTREYEFLATDNMALIAVMRAGLPMAAATYSLFPSAPIGHIGIARRENGKQPEKYFQNLPDLNRKLCVVFEPLIATGGTAITALESIKDHKGDLEDVCLISVISTAEGIRAIQDRFNPEEDSSLILLTGSIDDKVDEKSYIVPGMGDAGTRIFGTHNPIQGEDFGF